MTETGDHYQNIQLIEINDQTSSTFGQEQSIIPTDDAGGSTETVVCKICGANFVHGQSRRHHNRSKEHQAALKKFKEEKEKGTRRDVIIYKPKEKNGKHLLKQDQLYIVTLTAFFTLRYSLANYNKDFNVSINDVNWKDFGDIVLEVTNQDVTEVHAVQCRQIQTRNNVTISALSAEEGDFSVKKLCETLNKLRNKKNYEKTFFKLFTISNLSVEKDNNTKFTYDASIVKGWKNDNEKKSWSDRKVLIPPYKENDLLNSTDDPNDIFIFKILNHEDEDMNDDLNKFRLFQNQTKLSGLRELIKMMIEDKFDSSKDISNDIIKYIGKFGKYFRTSQTTKTNKLTKTDILVKVGELLLESYLVPPESVIEGKIEENYLELWKKTVDIFDIIIIRNDSDIVNKLYAILNQILTPEIGSNTNFSTELRVNKKDFISKALAWWKTGNMPLILTTETEKHLSSIIKVISFLKSENISLKFTIITNLQIDQSYFPEHLNVFFNLQNLKTKSQLICSNILNSISIEVLDFPVKLREIVDCNDDYLKRLKPDALLNMFFKDYSFRDLDVPITGNIVDNILVFKKDAVNNIKEYFKKKNTERNAKMLSYLVNIKGCPTLVQVPPKL